MVLARPDERETWPYHCSLPLFTMVRSSRGPIACWILARTTSSLVDSMIFVCDVYLAETPHFHGLYSSLSPAVRVHDSQTYREMDVTRERIIRIFELREILLSFQTGCSLVSLCYPGEYFRLGTLFSYNWAQLLEACDCLKPLSIYFDVCVDVTGVVCHQRDLLDTDLHAVGFGGFAEKRRRGRRTSYIPTPKTFQFSDL